jgi:hypothetical protein
MCASDANYRALGIRPDLLSLADSFWVAIYPSCADFQKTEDIPRFSILGSQIDLEGMIEYVNSFIFTSHF